MNTPERRGLPAGTIGTIQRNYTLHIARDLLLATGWKCESKTALVAHLLDEGRVRLRLRDDAGPKVDAMRAEVESSEREDRAEVLAMLADRYRDVVLYVSSNRRVQLNRDILAYLAIEGAGGAVFCEAKEGAIDIMSLAYRNKRQAGYAEEFHL